VNGYMTYRTGAAQLSARHDGKTPSVVRINIAGRLIKRKPKGWQA